MSNQDWTPGKLTIHTPIVISDREQNFNGMKGGGYGGARPGYRLNAATAQQTLKVRTTLDSEYHQKLLETPATTNSELINNGVTSTEADPPSDLPTIEREKNTLTRMIQLKNESLQRNLVQANNFYGSDPHNKSTQEYINTFNTHLIGNEKAPGEVHRQWKKSYTAGYSVRLYAESIRILTHRSLQLDASYAAVQARQHAAQQAAVQQAATARSAAEQAARAEAARAAAEQAAQEQTRHREAEKLFKEQRAHRAASEVADRFDALLSQLRAHQPENLSEKIRWIKDNHQKLYAAHVEASKAERAFKDFYNFQRRKRRWRAIKDIQKEISGLTRQIKADAKTEMPTITGAIASVRPLVISSDGMIAGFEGSPFSLGKAVDTLGALRGALSGGPVITFLASVFYTPTLGNGELQRNPLLLTIPVSLLVQNNEGVTVPGPVDANWLPFRVVSSVQGEHIRFFLRSSEPSQSIRVRQAKFNRADNLYTFTTEDSFPITLTWTPKAPPGDDIPATTELPATDPGTRIFPGARVTQIEGRLDELPACEIADPYDYILTFPIASGIESIYMMATRSGPRYEPGTATGRGQEVGENWLGGATLSSGSPVPAQIADKLRGQDFRNFDRFREKFWRAIASDSSLSQQFGNVDLEEMRSGAAPFTDLNDNVGGREKYEIHHKQKIADEGAVYDVDNLTVLTPKAHIELHKSGIQQ